MHLSAAAGKGEKKDPDMVEKGEGPGPLGNGGREGMRPWRQLA